MGHLRTQRQIGLILIVLGIAFTLQQTNIWNFTNLFKTWWPLLIMFFGVIQLLEKSKGSFLSGSIITLVGLFLLIQSVYGINVFNYFWPLILIVIGSIIFFTKSSHSIKNKSTEDKENNLIDIFTMFSSAEQRIRAQSFQSGRAIAIFGEIDLDLTEIELEDEKALLELTAIFGTVRLRLPDNVQIQTSGYPIFGSIEDKRNKKGKENLSLSTLKMHNIVLFGEIRIID